MDFTSVICNSITSTPVLTCWVPEVNRDISTLCKAPSTSNREARRVVDEAPVMRWKEHWICSLKAWILDLALSLTIWKLVSRCVVRKHSNPYTSRKWTSSLVTLDRPQHRLHSSSLLSSSASVRPSWCDGPSTFPTTTQALGVSQSGNSVGFHEQCYLCGIRTYILSLCFNLPRYAQRHTSEKWSIEPQTPNFACISPVSHLVLSSHLERLHTALISFHLHLQRGFLVY